MSDYSLTTDILFEAVQTAWNDFSVEILGELAEIQWPNVERTTPIDLQKFWLKVNIATISERPRSLKNSQGIICYETNGVMILAIVCPKNEAGLTKGRQLAERMKNFFKALRIENLKFKGSQIQEIEPEETIYILLVNINYEHFFTLQLN